MRRHTDRLRARWGGLLLRVLPAPAPSRVTAPDASRRDTAPSGPLPPTGVLLGHSLADGHPVIAHQFLPTVVAGHTGSGKTATAAFIVSQRIRQGARIVGSDPHRGSGEGLSDRLAALGLPVGEDTLSFDPHDAVRHSTRALAEYRRREAAARAGRPM